MPLNKCLNLWEHTAGSANSGISVIILHLIYSHYKNPAVVTIMPWVRDTNKLPVLIHYTPIKDVDQFTGWSSVEVLTGSELLHRVS